MVIALGVVPALESILGGQRRISRQRQSLGVKIVVDLAVAGGVPSRVVPDRRILPACLVIAQEMSHLVNQQRRVFLDRVRAEPVSVVVQPPVRIHPPGSVEPC